MADKAHNIDYKEKALKYKLKYLELKKKFIQLGGITQWYNNFKNNLDIIYTDVNNYYSTDKPVALTGSAAIFYILYNLNLDNKDLFNMLNYAGFKNINDIKPNDLDFVYKSSTVIPNNETLINGEFKLNKPNQRQISSVTYELTNPNNPNWNIKSFDVTKVDRLNSFNLNGIYVLNLNSLKSYYTTDPFDDPDRIEKDNKKKELLKLIIQKIGEQGKLAEFGLDDNVTYRHKKPKSMFGDDDDI